MPQIKKQIPVCGLYPPLRADLITFIKKRCKRPVHVHESHLQTLCWFAIEPEKWAKLGFQSAFMKLLCADPELAVALLAFIQKKWFGRRTKSQRIQNFLAVETSFKPLKDAPEKSQWDMTDGEVATGYELATGEAVTKDDVIKARKELASRIKRGSKYAKLDGWIQGGKSLKKPSV